MNKNSISNNQNEKFSKNGSGYEKKSVREREKKKRTDIDRYNNKQISAGANLAMKLRMNRMFIN